MDQEEGRNYQFLAPGTRYFSNVSLDFKLFFVKYVILSCFLKILSSYVYDTNVGDIAPLTTYFNPNVWSDTDLNNKFGQRVSLQDAAEAEKHVFRFFSRSEEDDDDCNGASLQPKLIIFPEIPKLNNKEATRSRNPSQSRSNKLISKPQSLGICSDSQTNRTLTSKRPSLSLLPNPPDSTPSNDESEFFFRTYYLYLQSTFIILYLYFIV